MTYRELIDIIGMETFKKYGEGWYNMEWIKTEEGLKYSIDRYAIMGHKPFYLINIAYNKAYENDPDSGSTYDWLSQHPTEDEINKWKKENNYV